MGKQGVAARQPVRKRVYQRGTARRENMTKQPSRVGVKEMPEMAGMSRTFTGGGWINRESGQRVAATTDGTDLQEDDGVLVHDPPLSQGGKESFRVGGIKNVT